MKLRDWPACAAFPRGWDGTGVSDVTLRFGFAQGRFGAYNQEAFWESPSVTL